MNKTSTMLQGCMYGSPAQEPASHRSIQIVSEEHSFKHLLLT